MKSNSLHTITVCLLVLLVMLVIAALFLSVLLRDTYSERASGTVAVNEAVLRFHVRANSDSDEDQTVKQEVKGRVLEQLALWEEETDRPYTKADVMALCESHLQDIKTIADEVLLEAGYAYTANAYLTREEFPIRSYGDLTFPAGVYDALRIDLGVANGHNWWCMLYPSLCFVDATYSVVPEESKEELKSLVTDDDYEALLQDSDTEIEIHSAVVDWIQDWFAK